MRIALIALAVSSLSIGYTAQANQTNQKYDTVETLQTNLSQVETEYNAFMVSSATINNTLDAEQTKLAQAQDLEQQIIKQKDKALADMNTQYSLMINDPTHDITLSQTTYRNLAQKQHQNAKTTNESLAIIKQLNNQLVEKNNTQFKFVNDIEMLNEEINVARVQRLRDELTKTGTIEISQNVDCNIEQSFSKCMSRSVLLSKQKASKIFFEQLFSESTEAKLISQQKNDSKAHVKLINHKILSDGFSNKANYSSTTLVTIKGLLPKGEACQLLSLPSRYCEYQKVTPKISNASKKNNNNDDATLYELTVRSNLYDDEVFIDGVSYGSSKVSIMLSPGMHNVVIKKANFNSYKKEIELTRNTVFHAKLEKIRFNTEIGQEGQDSLSTGELGPKLIGIPTSKQALLKNNSQSGFSVSQNPITVGDFNKFVSATNYITDAESGKGCAELIDRTEKFNSELNWRKPGFKQTEQHPVVCVTKQDSNAYLTWLSNNTGQKYRLPNNDEWEYIARAGSQFNYWWGDDIGNAQANCAYCGSQWSNNGTAPVESFSANKFGVFDTVGNVWELTNNKQNVVRGGAWNFPAKLAQLETEFILMPDFNSNYVGFRALREN